MSSLLKLNLKDLSKGVVVAFLVALFGMLQSALNGHGIEVASYDWSSILDVSFKAAGAYLIKNLFSDSEGKVLGKIG